MVNSSVPLHPGFSPHLTLWHCSIYWTHWLNDYTHWSGITLRPLTGEVNNTDYLFIVAPFSRWDISGSKWTFSSQSWCVRSRKKDETKLCSSCVQWSWCLDGSGLIWQVVTMLQYVWEYLFNFMELLIMSPVLHNTPKISVRCINTDSQFCNEYILYHAYFIIK